MMQCNFNYSFIHSLCSETNFEKCKQKKENRGQGTQNADSISQQSKKGEIESISLKRERQPYQASFEKLFLKQHKQVFTKQFQKFVKSLQAKEIWQHFYPNLQVKQSQKCPISLQLFFSCESGLSQAHKSLFSRHLQTEEKLMEFLDFIALTCPSRVALGFIQMTSGIYNAFSSLENRSLAEKQIIDWGVKMASGQIVKQIDNFSNRCFKQHRHDSKFIRMVQVYCVTVLFILFQYFQNPFLEQSQENIGSCDSDGSPASESDCDSDFSESILRDKCRKRLKSEP